MGILDEQNYNAQAENVREDFIPENLPTVQHVQIDFGLKHRSLTMEALRDRLTELTVPPPEDIATNAEAAAIESSRGRVRTRLLEAWTDPDVVCRNGLIADGNRVICGVTGSNSVIYSLGPGAGSILYCIVCVCINRVGCVYSYCVP